MNTLKNPLHFLVHLFSRPALFFYVLPWLMVLLVLGTISQRYLGLYQSQKIFFGSFIFWIGPLPTPGAYTLLAIITLNLSLKLLLKSPLKKQTAGILLSHMSILILLVGGLMSALFREEGYMVLHENETSNRISDYHHHELVILENNRIIDTVSEDRLHAGETVQAARGIVTMKIKKYFRNAIVHNGHLLAVPENTDDERNQSGVIITNEGRDYAVSENIDRPAVIESNHRRFTLMIQHAQRPLPFSLLLRHFEKTQYPGTEIARGYRSEVTVKEGVLTWDDTIEMNHPLNHQGYTLYQSSFIDTEGKIFTVLAVVKNIAVWFPYLAITSLCAGLLTHLIILLRSSKIKTQP